MEPAVQQARLVGGRVAAELEWLWQQADQRCVLDASKWASEVLYYLPSDWTAEKTNEQPVYSRAVRMARDLIVCRDFHMAAHVLDKEDKSRREQRELRGAPAQPEEERRLETFLHMYARFMAHTRIRLENEAEAVERRALDRDEDGEMSRLHGQVWAECEASSEAGEDVWMLWLRGMIELSLDRRQEALASFSRVVGLDGRMWPAWEELAGLIEKHEQMDSLLSECAKAWAERSPVIRKKGSRREQAHKENEDEKPGTPSEWMGEWFACKALSSIHLHRQSIERCEALMKRGLERQPMMIAHQAAGYNQMHEHDPALELFDRVRRVDPCRIEHMNLYSDSLYIRNNRVLLADLSHSFFRTHKFHWQTCCIVANYYSMRRDHEQAIKFLQRALKLNPRQAATWTLIGHEFMELKNNSAACLSYRRAIEIDPKDHRGWYGLGQLYDILKMHSYSVYYYQEAHKCRPQDSRMLVALGEVFGKMNRKTDAQRCFLKAFKVGDVEGTALIQLAKLFENDNASEQAAHIYEKYLNVYFEVRNEDENVPVCLRFLAAYYVKKGDLNAANMFAQRCLEYDKTREDGRAVLRQIAEARQKEATARQAMTTPGGERAGDKTPGPGQGPAYNSDCDMAVSDGEDDLSF